jgi:uroporphyrin-III C-methyltransferase/precorrin-2 dehydrogenase/sirohydrochlorin ferrochelatase
MLNDVDAEKNNGEVYLIGAGPGAADLLTFRALRLMQQADVVVYDRLVSADILDLARRDSEKIYVGKQRDNHTLPQESINELLASLAKSGKRVARLKGGDPFIFGRGGEEIETLMQHGVSFQVVPGITAASGCASYAGIPLTHRDHAQSCTFVTGHLKDGSINLNWTQLAAPNQTIVIYMGLVGLEHICQSLIAHGSSPDLPIAVVQQGTTTNQKVVTGTLSTLATIISDQDIKPPTLIIIGTVVTLRAKLNWFQTKSIPN